MERIYAFSGTVAQLQARLNSPVMRLVRSLTRDAQQLVELATGRPGRTDWNIQNDDPAHNDR